MITQYYQVEFYSHLENKWVPLFAREITESAAKEKAQDWLPNARSRVTKVTLTTEVVEEYHV